MSIDFIYFHLETTRKLLQLVAFPEFLWEFLEEESIKKNFFLIISMIENRHPETQMFLIPTDNFYDYPNKIHRNDFQKIAHTYLQTRIYNLG